MQLMNKVDELVEKIMILGNMEILLNNKFKN